MVYAHTSIGGITTTGQTTPVLIETLALLEKLARAYLARPTLPIYFDTETTGLSPQKDRLVSLQLMQLGYAPAVLDMRRLDVERVGSILRPLFNGDFLIVGHNLKFDIQFLKVGLGLLPTRVWDCMIAEQVIYGLGKSDAAKQNISFSLKACAHRRGIEMSKEERNWFIDLDKRDEWGQPFPEEQLHYMGEDVRVLEVLQRDQGVQLSYEDNRGRLNCALLEMRVVPALASVELAGVRVDQEEWRQVIQTKEEEAKAVEEEVMEVFGTAILEERADRFDRAMEVYRAWEQARDLEVERLRDAWMAWGCTQREVGWGAYKTYGMNEWRVDNPNPGKPKADGSPPNIGSVSQLMDAFKVLGIPAKDTSSETLKELEDDYEAVGLLLTWRKAIKFSQSFGENLLAKIGPDGRLHPEYQQIGASSMRMSCTNPNFQQIPSKGDGKKLRACIKAEPGNTLLVADYSSQELRILADLSGDETMLRMFKDDVDLHSETARIMFDLNKDINPKKYEIVPGVDARTAAKTINYGIAYGMSSAALARSLGVSRERGEELMQSWFNTYLGVKKWLDRQRRLGVRDLKISTICGWVRHFPRLPQEPTKHRGGSWEDYKVLRGEWRAAKSRIERQSMNTPIQGAAAGITKLALVNFFEHCVLNNENGVVNAQAFTAQSSVGGQVRVIAVVHDELVVECPEEVAGIVSGQLADAMDSAFKFYCPTVYSPRTEVTVTPYWRKE